MLISDQIRHFTERIMLRSTVCLTVFVFVVLCNVKGKNYFLCSLKTQ